MCYSGRCYWETFFGDCGFPHNKEVREKYKYPVCEMDISSKEEQEYFEDAKTDILNILKQNK